MSKQYKKRKAKKEKRRNKEDTRVIPVGFKEDSRVIPVGVDMANQEVVMSDGTTVDNCVSQSMPRAELEHRHDSDKLTGASLSAFVNATVDYSELQTAMVTHSGQEEPISGRRARSTTENTSIREDRYALTLGDRVLHMHHEAFGSGRVIRRKEHGLNEYRWHIRWNDGHTRIHGADYLKNLDKESDRKEAKAEPIKESNPNRAFRAHKSNKRRFGGVSIKGAMYCAECEVVLPGGGYGDPGDPRRWCHTCYRERREQRGHSVAPSLSSTSASLPRTAQTSTAKQLSAIAELSHMKGVSSNVEMSDLSFAAASVIISAWKELPDLVEPPMGPHTISHIQKRVIRDLERRTKFIPMQERTVTALSSEDASQLIKQLQSALNEAQ